MKFVKITAAFAALAVAGCSTQVENARSENFEPVFPVEAIETEYSLPSGGIYSTSGQGLFATDRRAKQVGDLLTVQFTERFSANKSQTAGTARTDNFNVALPGAIFPKFDGSGLTSSSQQAFSGSGSAAQSNSLTGRLSVSVVRVLPGGNLEILGQKKMTLNNGDEYVRISGIVRPADISAQNVILSERIANAQIEYIGAGQVADAGKQGWLRRGLNTVSPF